VAKILVAASTEPQTICQRMLSEHELCFAATMTEAEKLLQEEIFDLIVCTIVFDDSRMFDLLRLAKSNRKWKNIPFLCLKVRSKLLDYALAVEGVQIAAQALGAAAFLDIDNFKLDPEKEMAEQIELHIPRKNRDRTRV
jgi:response regulator RpfG family c-di-GMP phosphodiesterase